MGQPCFNSLQVGQVLAEMYLELRKNQCFNSLQVGQVRLWFVYWCVLVIQFQFLIGRLGTHLPQLRNWLINCVSIPYRQARYKKGGQAKNGREMFQFLIGRLGTHQQRKASFEPKRFQFLIGRLGTHAAHKILQVLQWFQFLIGRLGTKDYIIFYMKLLCFNSLQVGQVHDGKNRGILYDNSFQFLIGRLGTNNLSTTTPTATIMFQFLIGRLGTGSCQRTVSSSSAFQFLIGRLGTYQLGF